MLWVLTGGYQSNLGLVVGCCSRSRIVPGIHDASCDWGIIDSKHNSCVHVFADACAKKCAIRFKKYCFDNRLSTSVWCGVTLRYQVFNVVYSHQCSTSAMATDR